MGEMADDILDSMWDDRDFFGDFDSYMPRGRVVYRAPAFASSDFLPRSERPATPTPVPAAVSPLKGVCKACGKVFNSLSKSGYCPTDQLARMKNA